MKFDYLVVGAGPFGSVFARQMTDAGASCLVIDKRKHIAGNCYTERKNDIDVHKYGAHIFHTSNKQVWSYVNRFAEFNSYRHHLKVNHRNKIYSFPINMMTLHQLWGVTTPEEAARKIEEVRIPIENPSNLEDWILSQVGEEIYEKFIKGYTEKQWGRPAKDLPSSIIKRLPIRMSYNDCYFNDPYQGIPKCGYTEMFSRILKGIPVELGVNYLKHRDKLDSCAARVVYTGALDEFFEYDSGVLDWRSLSFEEQEMSGDYQGVSVMNYTEASVPYTRIVEHKYFNYTEQSSTIITKEYPKKWSIGLDKIYPVNDKKNGDLYLSYKNRVDRSKYILGGRLADYQYYDMHQAIGSALSKSAKQEK